MEGESLTVVCEKILEQSSSSGWRWGVRGMGPKDPAGHWCGGLVRDGVREVRRVRVQGMRS